MPTEPAFCVRQRTYQARRDGKLIGPDGKRGYRTQEQIMDSLNGQRINFSFPVSLSQGDSLLGWYRAQRLYAEGIILKDALQSLPDNSIVTVRIELHRHGKYMVRLLKALVHHQAGSTELLWLNQNTDLPDLLPFIAQSSPEQNHGASASRGPEY